MYQLGLRGNYKNLVDYIFWFVFIVFTNPGGILSALGEDSGDGGINVTDFLFVIILGCYVLISFDQRNFNDKYFNKTTIYLFIFLGFYLMVFGYIIPILNENPMYSPISSLIKNRHAIIRVVLVVIIYKFYLRSYPIFFKVFIYSSIIVLALFIISVITGIEILPIKEVDRRFININRLFLKSYGLLPLLIPMGAVLLVFKINFKFKKIIIIGFALMFLTWLLSLTRREIFGSIIYIILAVMIYNYLHNKVLISPKRTIKILSYSLLIVLGIYLSFPKYFDAGIEVSKSALFIIANAGQTTEGFKDERLGFTRKFIVDIIKEKPYFGTGFDNRWRIKKGDRAGYEAADYPFLGAIAMTGVVGLLFFLPIYIILLKMLFLDVRFLRKYKINYNYFESFMILLFIVYFIFDILQYMNWFIPISLATSTDWYFYLALYLASRNVFYHKISFKNNER